MEVDWSKNALLLAGSVIGVMLWISLWNIVELTVERTIDHHKNSVRSKYIIYTVMAVTAALLLLIFANTVEM